MLWVMDRISQNLYIFKLLHNKEIVIVHSTQIHLKWLFWFLLIALRISFPWINLCHWNLMEAAVFGIKVEILHQYYLLTIQ